MHRIRLISLHSFSGRTSVLLTGTIVLWLAVANVAAAQAPDDHGDTAELDSSEAARIHGRIDEIYSHHGPYDAQLIEAYSDLGSYYRRIDDHERAAQHYADALQVSRISHGLYNEQQLGIIEQLIASLEEKNAWEDVDDYHHLAFHTRTRLYEPGSPGQVQAVQSYGRWKVRAWRDRLLDGSSGAYRNGVPEDLHSLRDLYQDTLAASEDVPLDSQRLELLYGLALTEFEIARHMAGLPLRAFSPSTDRYINRRVCRSVADGDGGTERVCWTERVENPHYRSAQRDERRMRLRRAQNRVSSSAGDLEQLLNDNDGISAEEKADFSEKLDELNQQLAQLQQQSRRAMIRAW